MDIVCRNIGENLFRGSLKVDCMGCSDFVIISQGGKAGDPETADDKRFSKWKRVKDRFYCEACMEDLLKEDLE